MHEANRAARCPTVMRETSTWQQRGRWLLREPSFCCPGIFFALSGAFRVSLRYRALSVFSLRCWAVFRTSRVLEITDEASGDETKLMNSFGERPSATPNTLSMPDVTKRHAMTSSARRSLSVRYAPSHYPFFQSAFRIFSDAPRILPGLRLLLSS